MSHLDWAIGIYRGPSPLDLHPVAADPVLTAADVHDAAAEFVADPFLLYRDDRWHLFFELLDRATGHGAIGLADSSDGPGGDQFTYRQVVLREPFHLSYPYVFEWEGEHYMTPETLDAGGVRLYRATRFPVEWTPVATLVAGRLADPTVVRHDGCWYLFACGSPTTHDDLLLFVADRLEGPWREHPRSPLIAGDRRSARPAGRPVFHDGAWHRFAQDCEPVYGSRVRAFRIAELTPDRYAETPCLPDPVLAPAGDGWNRHRMHHVDAHPSGNGSPGWIACVDGCAERERLTRKEGTS
jgi:hypothetical protein